MARWEPNARERLVEAALELFAEQGYEQTTVVQIAERAGLTKSTFFRHYPDKREVLFGGDAVAALVEEAIAGAPAEKPPMEAVAYALEEIGRQVFTPARREFAVRRQAVIAESSELREREALKELSLVESMTQSLERRGSSALSAAAASQLGALAWRIAFQRWSATTTDDEFGVLARQTIEKLRATRLYS
jgi:AcrR family transcriptional regulator